MSSLGDRLDAAIEASGKRRQQIAEEAGTTVTHISRITTGQHDNIELQLLIRLAEAAKTKVGFLLGESFDISPQDETTLLDTRRWIDGKLVTIDARAEPNASILRARATGDARKIADGPRTPPIENPFNRNVHMELQAVGESMTGAGIMPDDKLYALPPGDLASSIGKVVACRIGAAMYVKRLVSDHGRLYLRSEHPRYRSIFVDKSSPSFEILGVIIGRVGNID